MAKQSSGGRADPTLVSAGFRLGQSYIPGDYSRSFNKQYEGLIESYKAKYAAFGKGIESIGEAVVDTVEAIGERQKEDRTDIQSIDADIKSLDNEINQVATDATVASMKENATHYENNGPMGPDHSNAAKTTLLKIKDQLQMYADKSFLSKEDKDDQSRLLREVQDLRTSLNTSKSKMKVAVDQYDKDLVNTELSFKNDPALQLLLKQVTDPKANLKDDYGVKVFWHKGKKFYEYTDDRFAVEYAANRKNDPNVDPSMLPPPSTAGKKIISEDELFAGIVPKDEETVTAANGIMTEIGLLAQKTIKSADGKQQGAMYKDYTELEEPTLKKFEKLFAGARSFEDITTRDILIGSTTRNYREDLKEGIEINALTYSSLGLKHPYSKEALADGILSNDELIEADKNAILEFYTSPKTGEQKKLAVLKFAQYFNKHTQSYFENIQAKMDIEPTLDESKEKYKNRSVEYEQAFGVKAGGKAKTLTTTSDNIINMQNNMVKVMKKVKAREVQENEDIFTLDNSSVVKVTNQWYGYFKDRGWARVEKKGAQFRVVGGWKGKGAGQQPEEGFLPNIGDVLNDINLPTTYLKYSGKVATTFVG